MHLPKPCFHYVADTDNHAIRVIHPLGWVTTLAGNGKPGFVDGWGTEARFRSPVAWPLIIKETATSRIPATDVSGVLPRMDGSVL